MASLLAFIFSAGGTVIVLLFAAIWRHLRPGSRWVRRGLVGAAVFYTLASTYAIPYGANRIVTYGYHGFSAADVPAGRLAIVVLGFGELSLQDWDGRWFPVLDRVSMSRIAEAARVYRLMPHAWVISSGGGLPALAPRDHSPAAVMRDTLVHLGVPESRILLENQSQTTRDEAVLIAPMLRSLNADRVVLVTSDWHMRRSVGAFRSEGVEVIPAIARDPHPPLTWSGWILPSERGLTLSRAIAHELAGIVAYRVRYGLSGSRHART